MDLELKGPVRSKGISVTDEDSFFPDLSAESGDFSDVGLR